MNTDLAYGYLSIKNTEYKSWLIFSLLFRQANTPETPRRAATISHTPKRDLTTKTRKARRTYKGDLIFVSLRLPGHRIRPFRSCADLYVAGYRTGVSPGIRQVRARTSARRAPGLWPGDAY